MTLFRFPALLSVSVFATEVTENRGPGNLGRYARSAILAEGISIKIEAALFLPIYTPWGYNKDRTEEVFYETQGE